MGRRWALTADERPARIVDGVGRAVAMPKMFVG